MTARIRHRVAVLLVWVLAFTGSTAAFGTCSHSGGDNAIAATSSHADHASHEGHGTPAGMPTDPGASGCECGCPCAGACNQGCQSPVPVIAAAGSNVNIATALPAIPRGVLPHPSTHPPLRPPAAPI